MQDAARTRPDRQVERPDPQTPWPFAPLSEAQQRQRIATEAALRARRMRVFRAFDDTVAAGL